jgi:hypothetical protein
MKGISIRPLWFPDADLFPSIGIWFCLPLPRLNAHNFSLIS